MAFVLDASMTMSWCFDDESTPFTRSALATLLETYAEVPALWPIEVANVLAMGERKKRIDRDDSALFLRRLIRLDIRVQPELSVVEIEDLLTLTRRHGLTGYDAAYLELARRKRLPLATFDKDLLRAAPLEGVALLGRPS